MDTIDCVIVGAGVIGLAIARELATAGREVLVLEAADSVGTGTSSRNSEVIHAGIYYPPGSLKARMCVRGRDMLYRYCSDRGVDHRRVGKLIVATSDDQRPTLATLADRARANGVDDLREVTGTELARTEPALKATSALYSPSTGIVDSHALMHALGSDATAAGADIALRSAVIGGRVGSGPTPHVLRVANVGELGCRVLVNAAGLGAWDVARSLAGFPEQQIPQQRLVKGSYFSLGAHRAPFSHLVYPVPEPGGLGIHLTLDLAGAARFGPDVEYVDHIDYAVDPARAGIFAESVRRYWPGLPDDALVPDYAGIRPAISGPGPSADFRLAGPADLGIAGLVSLFGIESPGLTSCLAIAAAVREMLDA
ncbi:NAD(P)/FAD-dependent oxidoreductase [Gordonia sp. NPDC003425]